ncbi:MAG: leucine--tRNA ligase, partial [Candidatus Altiarchaeota archaeon]
RLKEREEKQLSVLKGVYGMTEEELARINEPMDYAQYFIKEHYRSSMKALGYSIDWRRQFTTADASYNAFVTWQYTTLHKRGLIKKGLHPVKYCVKDENPVTTHDLLEGEDADVQEFTLLKFPYEDGFLIAATLRPETVFGQTNMWAGPEICYVKADVEGEKWVISRECADKLRLQGRDVKILEEVPGKTLLGKYCKAPGIDRDIIILPSMFCNPKIGSGLVTSVPSDAPYDWMGIKDLQEDEKLCVRYGLNHDDIKKINVIPIIRTEEFGDQAAIKVCEDTGIKSQKETEKLKEATQLVYKTGFHTGVMLESCGKYAGMSVARAKDKVKQELLDEGKASTILEFSEPVVCRCGGQVVIAKAESWFVDYANEDWKETVRGAIEKMNAIPERTKQDYLNTVDWLREWPCIRNYGLGTKLPFDDRFMIEPLSDSTIYMAYYTIAHLLKELKPEQLTIEFFDYIFRNEGKPEDVSKKTKIPKEKLYELKKSFDYWYPQNWRCSALELIQNHLTFMLYHHTALFPYDKWPEGIATFGMGLLEGGKMSSSKGNVVLVKQACERHGADVVRLFLMGTAEPWQDFDWRENMVANTEKKLRQFYEQVNHIAGIEGEMEERSIDRWLVSRMQSAFASATESLEGFQTRKALQTAFYGVFNDLAWYIRRCKPNPATLREVAEAWVRLMTPFTPYVCEELWEILGGGGFAANADYPMADESKVNVKVEAQEEMLRNLREDVQKIVEVTGKTPARIFVYIAPEWKRLVYDAVKSGKTIKDVMGEPALKPYGKQVAKLMGKRKEEVPDVILTVSEEKKVLEESKEFLSNEFSAEITVEEKPSNDPEGKAKHALPGKPGIYVE